MCSSDLPGPAKADDCPVVEPKDPSSGRDNEQTKICKFYLQHRCRYGRTGTNLVNGQSCPHSHPAMCKKFCWYGSMKKYGCNKGPACKYLHPTLCKQSELKHECLNPDCKLQHLKNTRRSVPQSETSSVKPATVSTSGRNQRRSEVNSGRNQRRSEVTTGPAGRMSQPSGRSEAATIDGDFLDRLFLRLEARLEDLVNSRLKDLSSMTASQGVSGQLPFLTQQSSQVIPGMPPHLPPGMGYTTSPHLMGVR